MKLQHIKANGKYYRPQKAGIKNENHRFGNYPVCIIVKLFFGRYQVDYYDERLQWERHGSIRSGDEDTPNKRIILYPSGIEEICYL